MQSPPTRKRIPMKKILLVDDSSSLRIAVRQALTEAGYEVVEAEDGQRALSLLDGRRFHLIITDINMPKIDGFTLIDLMKKFPAYRYTPVVIISTIDSEHKIDRGQDMGANAWVVKPFEPAQLIELVGKLLPL